MNEAFQRGFEEGYEDGYFGKGAKKIWYFQPPLFDFLSPFKEKEYKEYKKGYEAGYQRGAIEGKKLLD